MNDWVDPLADYRKRIRRQERYKRFLREQLIWWLIATLSLTAFAVWAV